MKTGFVIVNFNDSETTKKLLANISLYEILDEIVVVDNCSTDNSYEELKKVQSNKITIIKSMENKGYAAGLNVGSKYLIQKYKICNIIFSNADIVIDKESDLKELLSLLNSNTSYGIVAPIIREHTGLNRGWKIPSPMQDALLNICYIHKYLRPKLLFYPETYYQNKKSVLVGATSGCFFCMKSSCLEEVGFFDENTFLYYEENIISTKLNMNGYLVVVQCGIEVFHNHSVTIDKNIHNIQKFRILKKSQLYFQKTYNHANILEIFFLNVTNMISLFIITLASKIKSR